MVTPKFCSTATTTVAIVMNSALSTLTAAITRARRSTPAQACTAAKAGTMNRPPAIASPTIAIATLMPRVVANTVCGPDNSAGGVRTIDDKAEIQRKDAEQTRTEQGRQQNDAAAREPRGKTGTDRDRDREDREIGVPTIRRRRAIPSPSAATATARQRRPARTSSSPAHPTTAADRCADAGSATRSRSRYSSMMTRLRRAFAGRRNEQAAEPAQHRKRHHQAGEDAGSPPPFAAMPPAMVPSRIAMKVAPSTSALPVGNSRRLQMIGQDAVFDRPEQRADHAEAEQCDKKNDDRMQRQSRAPRSPQPRSPRISAAARSSPCRSGRRLRRRARTGRNRAR